MKTTVRVVLSAEETTKLRELSAREKSLVAQVAGFEERQKHLEAELKRIRDEQKSAHAGLLAFARSKFREVRINPGHYNNEPIEIEVVPRADEKKKPGLVYSVRPGKYRFWLSKNRKWIDLHAVILLFPDVGVRLLSLVQAKILDEDQAVICENAVYTIVRDASGKPEKIEKL
jgi:hypothetical protein